MLRWASEELPNSNRRRSASITGATACTCRVLAEPLQCRPTVKGAEYGDSCFTGIDLKADTVIVNYDGTRVWLHCEDRSGRRKRFKNTSITCGRSLRKGS